MTVFCFFSFLLGMVSSWLWHVMQKHFTCAMPSPTWERGVFHRRHPRASTSPWNWYAHSGKVGVLSLLTIGLRRSLWRRPSKSVGCILLALFVPSRACQMRCWRPLWSSRSVWLHTNMRIRWLFWPRRWTPRKEYRFFRLFTTTRS